MNHQIHPTQEAKRNESTDISRYLFLSKPKLSTLAHRTTKNPKILQTSDKL
jgi:hypothetical protein